MPEKQEGYQKLRKQLKEGSFSQVYVFHGQESFLLNHYLGLLQKALVPDGTEAFNLHKFDGRCVGYAALKETVMDAPFMSDAKLILISDFDLYKLKDDEKSDWEGLLSDIPPGCYLVFIYNTLPYKPDKRTKWTQTIQKHLHTVEFALQDTARLCDWVIRNFAKHDKLIDRTVSEYLIFRCGALMSSLENEIKKISAYAKASCVTKNDINAVVVPILEAVAFDMTDAAAAGRIREAAEILQKLQWMKNPPEMILGALSKTMRGVYAACLARRYGKSARDVMEACGYRNIYPAEKLMKAAGGKSLKWCRNALRVCRMADARLKGGSRDREGVIEWVLASLV
ncbi:MAG: DNA polymerase III subunit delta [Oscillospiraceae bacterium]|nr:DNA polymerase III subunit delta [Oscillospiraceae bacterium]